MITTGFLEETFTLAGDYNSTIWDVRGLDCGSMHLVWTGADDPNTATAVLEASNDGVNWNDLSVSLGQIILTVADDNQLWEFERFTTRYVRLAYVANGNASGRGLIISWAHPIAK